MPLLYQQSKTPPLWEGTWGMRILVVWNKAARKHLITNNPSWFKREDISPVAIWSLKTQAPYLFLNRQLKGHCQEWQKYVGSPKTHETQLSNIVETTDAHSQVPSHHVQQKRLLELKAPNWKEWAFTDGSCTNKVNGSQSIGAEVYHPQSNKIITVSSGGTSINKTINRAELVRNALLGELFEKRSGKVHRVHAC